MTPDDPRHGTNAGHRAHYEPGADKHPCDPCRAAHADYKRNLWRRKYVLRLADLYVPTLPTTRRIRALQAIGWRLTDIDQALGHGDGSKRGGPNYSHNLTRQPRIHAATAQKVADLYERWSMTPGPSGRTRAIARNRGWAPPLAWDDIETDAEPNWGGVDPDIDPVVVMRLLEGQRVPSSKAEKDAAMEQWVADGGSKAELCRWHGWKTGRYGRPQLEVIEGGAA